MMEIHDNGDEMMEICDNGDEMMEIHTVNNDENENDDDLPPPDVQGAPSFGKTRRRRRGRHCHCVSGFKGDDDGVFLKL